VIGITRDAVNGWVGDGLDSSCVYFPTHAGANGNALYVQVNGNPQVALRKLEASLSTSFAGSITQIHTMDEILAGQLYPFQASYWLSSAVGGLALLLTLAGTFGVLSYVVTQRTKEIGIRMALGASAGSVARLVLLQSLKFSAAGAALGAAAALAITRLLAQYDMFMFQTVDVPAYTIVIVLVIAASACAAWVPSRRAASIEPLTTLRYD
jgi:ABC-type antimicrobial peptide transport system permease subunit